MCFHHPQLYLVTIVGSERIKKKCKVGGFFFLFFFKKKRRTTGGKPRLFILSEGRKDSQAFQPPPGHKSDFHTSRVSNPRPLIFSLKEASQSDLHRWVTSSWFKISGFWVFFLFLIFLIFYIVWEYVGMLFFKVKRSIRLVDAEFSLIVDDLSVLLQDIRQQHWSSKT